MSARAYVRVCACLLGAVIPKYFLFQAITNYSTYIWKSFFAFLYVFWESIPNDPVFSSVDYHPYEA